MTPLASSAQPEPLHLPERYLLRETIAQTERSVVYLALDVSRDVDVVIKVFGAAESSAFLRESAVGMGVAHPNLASCIDSFYLSKTSRCLVFDYLPGGTLRDRLEGRKPLPVDECVEVLKSILRGLVALHDSGWLHCDLKPENVLFDADGVAQLADFGAACETRIALDTLYTVGTPAYRAPERFLGQFDGRADLYGVGAIGYELLTGRPPFEGDIKSIDRAHRLSLADYSCIGSTPLREWLAMMLHKQPDQRPASAQLSIALLTRTQPLRDVPIARKRSWSTNLLRLNSGAAGKPPERLQSGSDGLADIYALAHTSHLSIVRMQDNCADAHTIAGARLANLSEDLPPAYFTPHHVGVLHFATGERRLLVEDRRSIDAALVGSGQVIWSEHGSYHRCAVEQPHADPYATGGEALVQTIASHQSKPSLTFPKCLVCCGGETFAATEGVLNDLVVFYSAEGSACVRSIGQPILDLGVIDDELYALALNSETQNCFQLWRLSEQRAPELIKLGERINRWSYGVDFMLLADIDGQAFHVSAAGVAPLEYSISPTAHLFTIDWRGARLLEVDQAGFASFRNISSNPNSEQNYA